MIVKFLALLCIKINKVKPIPLNSLTWESGLLTRFVDLVIKYGVLDQ